VGGHGDKEWRKKTPFHFKNGLNINHTLNDSSLKWASRINLIAANLFGPKPRLLQTIQAADIYLPLSQACGIVRAIRFLFLSNFIDLFTFFDTFDCFLPTTD
jgi:hypothetical protein